MFDFNKVENFDKHIRMSIPNYDQLFSTFQSLAGIISEEDSYIIDYGCSTGALIRGLKKKKGATYIGVDTSELLPDNTQDDSLCFFKGDALSQIPLETGKQCSVIVSMFFLQFLGKTARKKMLKILGEHVYNGATLLISEKVVLEDYRVDNWISRLHISEKRLNFSDTEILDKDIELIDCMHPVTEAQLRRELSSIGNAVRVWQSYSFVGYVVTPCEGY